MTGLAGKAVRGAAWSAAGRWGSKAVSLLTFAVLARILQPGDFGLLAFAVATTEIVRQVGQQGLTQALIRTAELRDVVVHTAMWLNLGANLIFATTLLFLAPVIEKVSGVDGFAEITPALALYLLLVGLTSVPESLLQRSLRFDALARRTIVAAVVSAVVALTLAFIGAGVWALVGQYVTQGAVSLVLVWRASGFRMRFQASRAEAVALLRFGWIVLVIDVATSAALFADTFLVLALLGPTALGYYSIAYRLVMTVVDLIAGVVSTLALPVLSRLQSDLVRMVEALRRISKSTFALAAMTFVPLAVAAPTAISVLFGEKWVSAAPVLSVLSLGAIFYVASFSDRAAMYSVNRPALELLLVSIAATLTVVGASFGAQWGTVGAATGVAARMAMMPLIRVFVMSLVLPMNPGRYLWSMASVLVSGVVAVAIGWGTQMALSISERQAQLVTAAICLVIFCVTARMLDRQFVVETIDLLRGLRGRSASDGEVTA